MMKSSSSYTAASLEHNLLCDPDEQRNHEGSLHPVNNQRTYCTAPAGVLRYSRESENYRLNLTTTLLEHPVDNEVECEYCGEKTRDLLNLTWIQEPKFCCAQQQQLCQMLVKLRCSFEGTCNTTTCSQTSDAKNELLFHGRKIEHHNKFINELPSRLREQSKMKIYKAYSVPDVEETLAPELKVLSFRLSAALGKDCWTVLQGSTPEKYLKRKEEEQQVLVPCCDHNPAQFGLCHHQGFGFLQKCYSNGKKFITIFPDGSTQVFYPSGNLALVIVVTERNRRVCIVFEDSGSPSKPIRAVFQSDGRAACYHSNGNIWLALNRLGGQCLTDIGARTCQWTWSHVSHTPTPFQPIFLSLNKMFGVRVLGNKKVFVSFLAKGQQAKFNVGACSAQGEYEKPGSGSSVLKEDLLVLAAKIRIHMANQRLHQCLRRQFHPQLFKRILAPHLRTAAQRLLEDLDNVVMSDNDRAFIYGCLKDC